MAGAPESFLVAVTGPTASGKSALAIELALQFSGEVVSCDAMQVYRGFDIGTAKVPPAERRGIAHHLIDICEPDELFSAGEFSRRARLALQDISARRRLPVVAGGTGFYLRALLEGLCEAPAGRPELRDRLRAMEVRSRGRVHRLLQRLDPEAASRIHPNDINKAIRAVEVSVSAGQPMSQLQKSGRQGLAGFRLLHLFLNPDREQVYRRIDQRVEQMFRGGLLEEVRSLLARGVPRSAQPFFAVGYREALAVLDGDLAFDAAIAQAQRATRRYAKRQWTWFRREQGIVVLPGFGFDPATVSAAKALVSRALNASGKPEPTPLANGPGGPGIPSAEGPVC